MWIGLVLAGCGGGGPDTPMEKCDALVDTMCDRLVDCLAGADGMHRECVQAFQELLPCTRAKDVTSSYNGCLDDLDASSCQLLTPTDPDTGEPGLVLPVACEGVILLSTAGPNASVAAPASRTLSVR